MLVAASPPSALRVFSVSPPLHLGFREEGFVMTMVRQPDAVVGCLFGFGCQHSTSSPGAGILFCSIEYSRFHGVLAETHIANTAFFIPVCLSNRRCIVLLSTREYPGAASPCDFVFDRGAEAGLRASETHYVVCRVVYFGSLFFSG